MMLDLKLVDFASLSPMLILLSGALSLLLVESFAAANTAKKACFPLTLIVLGIALWAAYQAPASESPLLTPWLRFDALARFFTMAFIVIGMATTLLSASFFHRFAATEGEYYFLLLAAVLGLIFIGAAADFLTLFLGLETLSIALYILCGYIKRWNFSHEAAIKYFLLGALSAAFLLYGIALIYGATGTTRFDALLGGYQNLKTTAQHALFLGGAAFVTLGLCFKATIVPFHTWAPDVYDGAPTPVTAFMAVGTKMGAFAALIIVFLRTLPHFDPLWNQTIAWLAFPTLLYANFVALRQTQMRRFFAYSGISHAGFLLIPLAVGTESALPPLLFYLLVYGIATLGAFAVLAFIDEGHEGVQLRDLQGLFLRSPVLAGILALCLLTLAGIPPTAGFLAKFYLFKVAFQAGYVTLIVFALLMTILAAYYYLRIISVMLSQAPAEAAPPQSTWPAALVGLLACAAIFWLSLYPTPLLEVLAVIPL